MNSNRGKFIVLAICISCIVLISGCASTIRSVELVPNTGYQKCGEMHVMPDRVLVKRELKDSTQTGGPYSTMLSVSIRAWAPYKGKPYSAEKLLSGFNVTVELPDGNGELKPLDIRTFLACSECANVSNTYDFGVPVNNIESFKLRMFGKPSACSEMEFLYSRKVNEKTRIPILNR